MATRDLIWDEKTGILKCKIVGFLSEDEAKELAADLTRMVQKARRESGRLRLLFDNQQGAVFSARSMEALAIVRTTKSPDDRAAILVSDSLHKLQAMRAKSEGIELFTSELDAVAWLISQD
jgi:hypothetical protein